MTDGNLSCRLVHVDFTVADMARRGVLHQVPGLAIEDCTVETEAALFLSGGTCPKMRMVFLTIGGTNCMKGPFFIVIGRPMGQL